MKVWMVIGIICLGSGCYQIHSDDDLRAVPVTNNPHVVPSEGGGWVGQVQQLMASPR